MLLEEPASLRPAVLSDHGCECFRSASPAAPSGPLTIDQQDPARAHHGVHPVQSRRNELPDGFAWIGCASRSRHRVAASAVIAAGRHVLGARDRGLLADVAT